MRTTTQSRTASVSLTQCNVFFSKRAAVTHNALVDTRGTQKRNRVPILALREQPGTTAGVTCTDITEPPCAVVDNIQHMDITAEDYKDIGLYLEGSNWKPRLIVGNQFLKVSEGLVSSE